MNDNTLTISSLVSSVTMHLLLFVYCSLAWIEMRMILVFLLHTFDLIALAEESKDWIESQRIFFLWEKLPLRVQISAAE